MTKYRALIGALLLSATTSLAIAQGITGSGTIPGYRPLPLPQSPPVPVAPLPPPPVGPSNVPTGTCDPSGCWGMDGARYSHAGGNFMYGSNGKVCQYVAPGAPLTCN